MPLLYKAKYYLYRLINRQHRTDHELQYKLNFNALLKENPKFQDYCFGAAENLEDKAIVPKLSCKGVIQDSIRGAGRYTAGQSYFFELNL